MTLAARAMAREREGPHEFEVATGEFTFVALDQNDKPREILA
jgi:acyl-CoA hydrolase